MADTKLSALTELAAAPAVGDELYIRDISEAAADESKRILMSSLRSAQSAVEGETDEVTFLSPNLVNFNPAVAKVFAEVASNGVLQANSRNVSSSGRDADPGDFIITHDTDFSTNTGQIVQIATHATAGSNNTASLDSKNTGTLTYATYDDGTIANLTSLPILWGDQ